MAATSSSVVASHTSVSMTSRVGVESGMATSSLPDPLRLWIGNILPHATEYHLLKIARPLGTITRFDFKLHTSGPLAGKPRGYAFISYATHEEAVRARQVLSRAVLGGARLDARWAHEHVPVGTQVVNKKETVTSRPEIRPETKIRAIEAKLMNMDNCVDELVLEGNKKDVRRLPKVKGPLQLVNKASRNALSKPYVRRK